MTCPWQWTFINLMIFICVNAFMMGVSAKTMQLMIRDDDYMPGIVCAQIIWPVTLSVLLGVLLVQHGFTIPMKIITYIKTEFQKIKIKREAENKRKTETPPQGILPL